MATLMRRAVSEQDKASRRCDILVAAKHVFSEQGYHATTIADIACSAGLSYGSIYSYYASKESLFHELMSVEAAALRAHIAAAAKAALDDGAAVFPLRAAVRATIEFYDGDRALVRLLFRDALALGESFEEHLSQIQSLFVDDTEALVLALQSEGVIRVGPSRLVAYAITTLVGQLARRRLVVDDGLSPASLADFVVDLLLHGVLAGSLTDSGAPSDTGHTIAKES
ncbi:MAG: TetR/AcrR family transcriptional regulator [Acidimicrobiales bacterium]